MADSDYPHPPDEFDFEAQQTRHQGAHRAEEPFWRRNLVYLIVGAVALIAVLALVISLIVTGGGVGDKGSQPSAEPTAAGPSGSPTHNPQPPAAVDKTLKVRVLNGSGISGLAGDWKRSLQRSGWTNVGTGNSANRQQDPIVFYKNEANRGAAEALAQEVGAGQPQQSSDYESPITFIATREPGN
ncbi:LytR C-terminal domain-containing protein [Devriesea agamarum]|uniref:LytR C-terminal domain-containing protein n=1 Tax=Devriesea agamarum TaxID=472569 RepID=UPI00071DF1C7|nr:LytR C-terminal domain-containing protein [Devriesea agamarum]